MSATDVDPGAVPLPGDGDLWEGILHTERDGIFWRCGHIHRSMDEAECCALDCLAEWGLAEVGP